jgi:hypothetical protein
LSLIGVNSASGILLAFFFRSQTREDGCHD